MSNELVLEELYNVVFNGKASTNMSMQKNPIENNPNKKN